MMLRSVQARLTAWYVVVTAIFLVVFSMVTYALLRRTLQQRMDESLVATARSLERSIEVELAEHPDRFDQAVVQEASELPFPDRAILVLRADGSPIAVSSAVRFPRESVRRAVLERGAALFTLDEVLRVSTSRFTIGGHPVIVVVARRLDDQTELLEAVRATLVVSVLLWTACAGAIGYWLVRKTLEPVLEMSEQQRRFMADASHELRTPVAIIRGESEVALSNEARPAAELRESLDVIEGESRLLSAIIEDLFLLARADAGQNVLAPTLFYLDELIADVLRSHRSLASGKSIEITTSLRAESTIEADERLVRRLLANLVDNAIKFTPPNGSIAITLEQRDALYAITVADSAAPIPEAQRARIFERFYRGDSATPGAGLGLSIASSIAELHGGGVELRGAKEGNVFVVELPLRLSVIGDR